MKPLFLCKTMLLIGSIFYAPQLSAYLTATGDGTKPATWVGTPITGSFDKASGNYFFGLDTSMVTTNTTSYNVCYANYRKTGGAPVLATPRVIPLATGDLATEGAFIYKVAAASSVGNPTTPTILAAIAIMPLIFGFNTTNTTLTNANEITLYDGSTDNMATGMPWALAGGNDLFFAAVNGASTISFGEQSSGIAAGTITRSKTTSATTLTLYNPVTGTSSSPLNAVEADLLVVPTGNCATNSDGSPATAFVYSPSGGTQANALENYLPNTFRKANGLFRLNLTDLWYDPLIGNTATSTNGPEVGRVFVTTTYATATPPTLVAQQNALNWGVGTFVVNKTTTSLTVTPTKLYVAPGDISSTAAYMMGIITKYIDANPWALEITKVRTMHTSTGLAYLIFAGGSSDSILTTITNDNNVYAVPLVNNSRVAWTDGLPAQPNAFINGQYTTPVSPDALGQRGADDMISTFSAAALVGGFYYDYSLAGAPILNQLSLPCGPGAALPGDGGPNPFVQTYVSDLYVDNDAVYVATSGPVSSDINSAREQGLWKSQAIFNALGQIDHWTDWQKVIPNDMGTGNSGGNGSVDLAAVDGYTGHVWAVNSTNKNAVVTQWTSTSTSTPPGAAGLAAAINNTLQNQCFSVLDLNASTTNWGSETVVRATLFGGTNKVAFAATGIGVGFDIIGTTTNVNISIADNAVDYSDPANLYTLALPAGAGAVVALGYSGWTVNAAGNGGDNLAYPTPGFFLAGCAGTATTTPGLYAYVQDTTQTDPVGFDPTALTTLSDLFAPTNGWVRLTNVVGLPTKIISLGGNLHVLTRSLGVDRIYTGSKSNTLLDLNSSFVITGAAGSGNLSNANQIFDFVISVSSPVAAYAPTNIDYNGNIGGEQLLALTTDGIYTTSCSLGMNAFNLTQANAGWMRIAAPPVTSGYFTDYFSQPDYNRNPQTFHFANFAQNPAIKYAPGAVYNKNIWYQLNRQGFGWSVAVGGQTTTAGTLANTTSFAEEPSQTATYNVAQKFGQTTTPTIYYNFPVNSRLLYDDGSRRFFMQANPKGPQFQIFVLPYNAYDYNITSTVYYPKTTMQDREVASATGFYWMSPLGDTGRLTMSTNKGLISLQ